MTSGRTASPDHDHSTGQDQPGWIGEALAVHERFEVAAAGRC